MFKDKPNKVIISQSTNPCISSHSIAYFVLSSISIYGALVGLGVNEGVIVLVTVGVGVGDAD